MEREQEAAVEAVVDWLRGDQAERVRADAIRDDIPPEDALAHVIEHKFLSAARPSSPTPDECPADGCPGPTIYAGEVHTFLCGLGRDDQDCPLAAPDPEDDATTKEGR